MTAVSKIEHRRARQIANKLYLFEKQLSIPETQILAQAYLDIVNQRDNQQHKTYPNIRHKRHNESPD